LRAPHKKKTHGEAIILKQHVRTTYKKAEDLLSFGVADIDLPLLLIVCLFAVF
jgi:hypothetical protein